MIRTEGRSVQTEPSDEYQCRAEIAECGCPDDCERDHGNE